MKHADGNGPGSASRVEQAAQMTPLAQQAAHHEDRTRPRVGGGRSLGRIETVPENIVGALYVQRRDVVVVRSDRELSDFIEQRLRDPAPLEQVYGVWHSLFLLVRAAPP